MLSVIDLSRNKASHLTVLRDHADPRRHGVPRAGEGRGAAIEEHAPTGLGTDPEYHLAEFGSASTDESGEAHDLARAHGQAGIADEGPGTDALDRQHDLAGGGHRGRLAGEQHIASDHQPDQFRLAGFGDDPRSRDAPVLQHRDAIAQLEDLGQAMRYIDHGGARRAEPTHHFEQAPGLGRRQRRRRLVQDQQLQVARERLGDLDDLSLRRRKLADGLGGVERHPKLAEKRSGLSTHQGAIDAPRPAGRLASGEDVLGDRELRDQRAFLVDDADAEGARRGFVDPAERNAVEDDPPVLGRIDAADQLPERRLAGSVLPEKCVDLARPDVHRNALQGKHARERLAEIFDEEARDGARHERCS